MPRYFRKVIRITALDSPNVKLGLLQESLGLPVTNTIVIPGVLPYADYKKRLATWDSIRICIGIDGEFYEGAELLLFPPQWLNRAETIAASRVSHESERFLGIDTGEGGDKSAWAIGDRLGLLELIAYQTPDTNGIIGQTIALMNEWKIEGENVWFDRGGGGKEHADRLRAMGYNVNTVSFGQAPSVQPQYGIHTVEERLGVMEERYTYVNMRAQLYGRLSSLLDPANEVGYSIPARFTELRRQLAFIPKMYDQEGRLKLPPKRKRSTTDTQATLTDLLGCSPDEADAVVVMCHGALEESFAISAGGF